MGTWGGPVGYLARGGGGPPSGGTSESRFHLASPKLRADQARYRARVEEPTNPEPTSSLGEVLHGVAQPHRRVQREREGEMTIRQQPGACRGNQDGECPGRVRDQVPMWAPGIWPQQMPWGPPPLQATFDGTPDHVALFLSQVISHMDG